MKTLELKTVLDNIPNRTCWSLYGISGDDDDDDYTDDSDGRDDDDLLVVSLGGIASYQTHSTISLAMEIGP